MSKTVPAIRILEGEVISPRGKKVATEVRRLNGWKGDARLYRLSPPIEGDEDQHYHHLIVSAAVTPDHGPETFIFAADAAGEVLDWCELPGSFRGSLDHEAALSGAGYDIEG